MCVSAQNLDNLIKSRLRFQREFHLKDITETSINGHKHGEEDVTDLTLQTQYNCFHLMWS